MFKDVEYNGFEGRPDLKAMAERLTPLLASEIHRWRDDVEVRWTPHPDQHAGVLDLSLSLTLPNGISAMHTGTLCARDLVHDRRSASGCRWVWMDLLGLLAEKQHRRVEEAILESVET